MSDSDDLSTPDSIPSDSTLESSLRRAVQLAIKQDEDVTVNLARSRAEQELGLPAGFFKDTDAWKLRSRDVVTDEAENGASPEKPITKQTTKAGAKRKSDEVHAPRKKSKPSKTSVAASIATEKAEKGHRIGDSAQVLSEEESALSDPPTDPSREPTEPTNTKPVEDDDSDLSSVIDDPPPKKRRSKKSTSPSAAKPKPSKTAKPIKSSKPATKEQDKSKELSPDEEEIKRLQSWLLKCGVRKLWHRELAPYSSSKEKIRHLKQMLDDVGMTGRFSAEKAKQIKEARELKEELEAARSFNEQWGHDAGSGKEEEEDESKAPAKRPRPKGLVDFGDDDEDSD